jgi:hypothetical protein
MPARVPSTDDLSIAREWLRTLTAGGIEGLVIKDAAGTYPTREGQRVWWKVKAKSTLDLLAIGFTGTAARPTALVLAFPGSVDDDGQPVTAGPPRLLPDGVGEVAHVGGEAVRCQGGRHQQRDDPVADVEVPEAGQRDGRVRGAQRRRVRAWVEHLGPRGGDSLPRLTCPAGFLAANDGSVDDRSDECRRGLRLDALLQVDAGGQGRHTRADELRRDMRNVGRVWHLCAFR